MTASLVLRPIPSDHPLAGPLNDQHAVLTGLKGGRIALVGDDGIALNPVGGAVVATGKYAVYLKSAAGLHLSIDSAAGASLLTVNDTAGVAAANLVLTGSITLAEIATPSNPAATNQKLYAKTGFLARLTSGGVESRLLDGSQFTAAGQLITSTAANAPSVLAIGAANQGLLVNAGATALAYAASLQSLMTTTGDLVYASSANTPARLAVGAATTRLAGGTVPAWSTIVPTVLLSYDAASLHAGTAINALTETDFSANQTFTVANAASVVVITTRGGGQCQLTPGGPGLVSSRLRLDSAGANTLYYWGSQRVMVAGEFANPFAGAGPIAITGLATGAHTVKFTLYTEAAGKIYCRHNGFEEFSIQVLEFIP